MTNIEHMRGQIVETVIRLDEMELLKFAEDTELTLKGVEGIFNCDICEKEYGECDISPLYYGIWQQVFEMVRKGAYWIDINKNN